MTPAVRYPPGPITPHGAYHVLKGKHPMVALRSFDDTVVFHLMGGMAIADRTMPESVELTDLKGLIPPWRIIDQQGATQDGVTFVDSFYDPAEIEATVVARGRDAKHTRQVVRHLIGSLDPKQTSELSWFTQDAGRWWTKVRWFKSPVDPFEGAQANRQKMSLRLRADDALWRSYDHADMFRFIYEDDKDTFDYVTSSDLGDGWDIEYSGSGGGYIYATGTQAAWQDDPEHIILPEGRTTVCRRTGFATDTDYQVVEVTLGSFSSWSFPDNAWTDIWCRMNTTGTPGTDGIRLRLGVGWMVLSSFVGGAETIIRQGLWLIPGFPGETFTLVCGYDSNPRKYKLLRNGAEYVTAIESGTTSQIGAAYRGCGFGMHAGAGLITQATPASIEQWNAADNRTQTQSGFVRRVNAGDQPMWDRYTCFGPGTFGFANGPNSSDFVQFGPLLEGQVAHIRTDPRKRAVVDLTSVPSTPADRVRYQEALQDFLSFAAANNTPMLERAIVSQFGVVPPQGNLYSLLDGRFSDAAAIPPKPPASAAQEYHVGVSIVGGNADSQIIVAGTPLRRYPN